MRPQRILIVEDQPFQREYLLNLFRELGAQELRAAEDGSDALRCLEQERFDLVVSDLMMPGLDGVQLIQRLAALESPPLLAIMSSAPRQLMGSACMVARAHGIAVLEQIAKPARAPTIRRLLDKLATRLERSERRARQPLPAPTGEELERALRRGELRAWFQPKSSLIDGRIVAAEALVRWEHPQLGVLRPPDFMAELTSAGLDETLLWCMLAQAIDAQAEWARQGFRLTVAVNLPTHLLDDRGLPDRLAAFVAEAGAVPAHIVFELLECSRTVSPANYYAGTCRLRMKGFGLAQDDFGQGYSSLYNLVSTPFTELKIDRMLVHGCVDDEGLAAALESIVKLGRQLGLEVIAEGVEHPDELALLRRLRCDCAQGHLISEPVPPPVFTRLLCQERPAVAH
ncbi:EAL domain-containing response regulator [Pseudomonas sp. ZM23]|uniref:EAL domain-containing response regulator n=1 Tax=Pseudomonas triclosanedens TaxID=2961893 RepID=A0ABY7A2S2_9PSED|nr:EAL domain-containing response regulator [Pseudomonas triclosanedens]MCP8464674.1 EAL domain-containing response regulator [Pseudomonas triclosanedens]MCP8473605.1 EAL domain-containing response regulator [Pseudomonas triclosanedens]MCP8478442.1 EAL domain-containing response regulator [Pseudomonas triclosanedens]WAI50846.1 EAL domain-containing response regulator [Pseudomonas triclosanedens]